jgi:hypothetical protein
MSPPAGVPSRASSVGRGRIGEVYVRVEAACCGRVRCRAIRIRQEGDDIADINEFRTNHDLPEFDGDNPSQQIVNEVRADGRILMVRAAQLMSGEVK